MLKKQRNDLYLEIVSAGIDPQYFDIAPDKSNKAWLGEVVKIRNTEMAFYISQNKDEIDTYSCSYTYPQVGFKVVSRGHRLGFKGVLVEFKKWLISYAKDYIENELEAIDLWSPVEVFKVVTGHSSTATADDSKFTPQEKEHIRKSVQRFRQLVVQNFKPTKEQQQDIDSRLEHLADAGDSLSRRYWQDVALSTLISIAINLTVDTEGGRLLFKLFAEAFNQIIKALPPIT